MNLAIIVMPDFRSATLASFHFQLLNGFSKWEYGSDLFIVKSHAPVDHSNVPHCIAPLQDMACQTKVARKRRKFRHQRQMPQR
jgi:hypothetical protein